MSYIATISDRRTTRSALCFCETDRLFFFVNSRPRLIADAQEIIRQSELASALTHDSYIDLSGPKTFSAEDVLKAQDRGPLAPAAIQRIRDRLQTGARTLSGRYKALALANLI